jgi:hypothetical protein
MFHFSFGLILNGVLYLNITRNRLFWVRKKSGSTGKKERLPVVYTTLCQGLPMAIPSMNE